MKRLWSSNVVRYNGRRADTHWLVPMLCGLWLLPLGNTLHGVGTGTLDRVSGWFPAGTNLVVTATPAPYRHVEWRGDTNDATIANNEFSFAVEGSRHVEAVFKDYVTDYMRVPLWWLAEQNPDWANDFEAAARADHDGDGFETGQEYWSGTNPLDPKSYLRVDSIQIDGSNLVLQWQHDRVHGAIPPLAIQATSNLLDGVWSPVGTNAPVDGTNTWLAPLSSGKLFYRIAVTNAP